MEFTIITVETDKKHLHVIVEELQPKTVIFISPHAEDQKVKEAINYLSNTFGRHLLLKKYNIDKIKKSDWEKFVMGVDRMLKDSYSKDKMEQYKKNYLQAVSNIMGIKGENILVKLDSIPSETLVQMYYDDPILQIDFVYDPLELEAIIEAIEEHLDAYLEDL